MKNASHPFIDLANNTSTSEKKNCDRRNFIKQSVFASGAILFGSPLLASAINGNPFFRNSPPPRNILLRSGWQVENIGDIAHTPGLLRLLKQYVPDAQVTFWPHYHYLPPEEVAMLKRAFPGLTIVEGKLAANGDIPDAIAKAMDEADFFLNGSGPATLGWAEALAFKKRTGKPYGVYGVTYGLYGTPEKEMLSDAAFVYFRDSISLALAKQEGIHAPVMGFAPDAAFAFNTKDPAKANAFLKSNNLQPGKFLCCIPKHRLTPVWLHEHKGRPFDAQRNTRNEEMMEHDHLPLREAIIAVVRQSNMKVLIVAEDITQTALGKKELWDKLPVDVQKKVVWRPNFWMPDEALSTYLLSAGLFSFEMHSPIMCIGNGIPALVCRWQEQSSKGIMWRDIGLGDWLFDFDKEEELKLFAPMVLEMAKKPVAFKAKAVRAQQRVREFQRNTMTVVEKASKTIN